MQDEQENSDSQMEETETTDSENGAPTQAEGETKQEFTEREKQYYARIKKLEAENIALKQKPEQPSPGLSVTDTLYLAKAPIHEEDIPDVLNYAQKMGVSVKDAHEFFKPILKDRDSQRATATATSTGGNQRGVKPQTGESLIRKAREGEMSENDDFEALAAARMEQKLKNAG